MNCACVNCFFSSAFWGDFPPLIQNGLGKPKIASRKSGTSHSKDFSLVFNLKIEKKRSEILNPSNPVILGKQNDLNDSI